MGPKCLTMKQNHSDPSRRRRSHVGVGLMDPNRGENPGQFQRHQEPVVVGLAADTIVGRRLAETLSLCVQGL